MSFKAFAQKEAQIRENASSSTGFIGNQRGDDSHLTTPPIGRNHPPLPRSSTDAGDGRRNPR